MVKKGGGIQYRSNMADVLLWKKSCEFMVNLGAYKNHKTFYLFCRKYKRTYSYYLKVLKALEMSSYVVVRKQGRCLDIELTDKGKELSKQIGILMERLERK